MTSSTSVSITLSGVTTTLSRHLCDRCDGARQGRFEFADLSVFVAGLRLCGACELEVSLAWRDEQVAIESVLGQFRSNVPTPEQLAALHVCACSETDASPCSYCEATYA